ncbi:cold-shock protein [Serratia fonticola]|uniref:cold-shock protein n=1 Tax=Serratia fonticola TaxID=47917 RepID=UPI0013771782|nr:cold-shock protein [Serratia fonticola]NCG49715.1 cold-shock protein [Serratia fonticola]
MARDQGLEEILREDFETLNALAEKVMFLLARLLDGKLIFAARDDGMLVRLGKGRDSWTFEQPMISRGRKIQGWLREGSSTFGDNLLRRKLVDSALEVVSADCLG